MVDGSSLRRVRFIFNNRVIIIHKNAVVIYTLLQNRNLELTVIFVENSHFRWDKFHRFQLVGNQILSEIRQKFPKELVVENLSKISDGLSRKVVRGISDGFDPSKIFPRDFRWKVSEEFPTGYFREIFDRSFSRDFRRIVSEDLPMESLWGIFDGFREFDFFK